MSRFAKALQTDIGETGFEPATARPPAGCATRLRHSPWSTSILRTLPPSPCWRRPVRMGTYVRADADRQGPELRTLRPDQSCFGLLLASESAGSARQLLPACRAAYKQEHYRRIGSATSRTRCNANARSWRNGWTTSWSSFARGRALTAANPIRSSWSSTISARRTSISARTSPTGNGRRFSMRSPHARSFVRTAIVGELPSAQASRV